jgi:MoaA/NifB/PqqE/SkfB family radical SAM enzyme
VDQWAGAGYHDPAAEAPPPRRVEGSRQKEFVERELLRRPEHLKVLSLLGGETLLGKDVGDVVQCLVDAGVAPNMTLSFVTNGTVIKSPWLKLLERFKGVDFRLSVDAFGPYYEYIRYPARWESVVRAVEALRQFPNGNLIANVTFQAYNALNITELLGYLDSVGLPFDVEPVYFPRYLSVKVLPPRARRLAAERLRSYAGRGCRPEHRGAVAGLAAQLESAGDAFDARLMREFMLFTNDLDVTRRQSFRETHKELLELIVDAGFEWTEETLHAPGLPVLDPVASR